MINVLPLISTAICIISFILGFYVISLDPKKRLHQLFFISIITIAFYNFCAIFVYSAEKKNIFIFWYRLASFTMIFIPLILHTNMELVNLKKSIKLPILIIYYLLPIYFIYQDMSLKLTYKDFIKMNDFWIFVKVEESFLYYFFTIYVFSSYFISFFLLIKGYIKSKLKREKKQAVIFLFSLIFLFISFFIQGVILPIYSNKELGLNPITLSIMPFGIAIAIIKYRFLGITPQQICKDIIENVDESVIILDRNLDIILTNPKTNTLITDQKKIDINKIIFEYSSIKDNLQKILEGSISGFTSNLNYIKHDNSKFLMSVKFSPIKDRFQDITGILLIAQEIKGINEFMIKYKLTERELDVIKLLITGISNKDIAKKLNISESTIKSHIEHIYNKTHVNNKIELVNILKEFNLVL